MYMHLITKFPKHIKQKLTELNRDIDRSTTVVGDFSTPLSKIHRTSRQNQKKRVVKGTESLNNTVNQLNQRCISALGPAGKESGGILHHPRGHLLCLARRAQAAHGDE